MGLYSTRWHDSDSEYWIESENIDHLGTCRFVVKNKFGECFNKQGRWEHDIQPSDRDADFLGRTRYYGGFEQAANALKLAREHTEA